MLVSLCVSGWEPRKHDRAVSGEVIRSNTADAAREIMAKMKGYTG